MSAESPLLCISIADDLTGALEVGAKFAAHGLPSVVTTDMQSLHLVETPVLVIDTETRHVSAEEAATRVAQTASWAATRSPGLVYKKTDSTLRGNIAAEFRALHRVFPARPIVYAPAYPAMGRTVRNSELLVHGKPVHQTEFARDLLNPVLDCGIIAMLQEVPATVLDGESDEDIHVAAGSILDAAPPRLCAGPAALAGSLASRLGPLPEAQPPRLRATRCLIVNGSLHPVSGEQIANGVQRNIFDRDWVLLDEPVGGTGDNRALRVGECVRRLLTATHFDALIVFGGDTTYGIHCALGRQRFEAIGEITPGVPVSKSGDLLWITKAGGFGAPDILAGIREKLT